MPSHYSIPAGFVPFEFASYTRWAWALQPAWYAASPVNKAAHTVFKPVKAAVWGLLGLLFPLHTSTPGTFLACVNHCHLAPCIRGGAHELGQQEAAAACPCLRLRLPQLMLLAPLRAGCVPTCLTATPPPPC